MEGIGYNRPDPSRSFSHRSRISSRIDEDHPKKLLKKKQFLLKKQIEVENRVKILRQNNWMANRQFLKNRLQRLFGVKKGYIFGLDSVEDYGILRLSDTEGHIAKSIDWYEQTQEERSRHLNELAAGYLEFGSEDFHTDIASKVTAKGKTRDF